MDRDARSAVLRQHGARDDELDELLAYTDATFPVKDGDWYRDYPLADEEGVSAWDAYARDAADEGVFQSLRRRLVQLRFPVREGISEDPQYRGACRRGEFPSDLAVDGGLQLADPDGLRLIIHPTAAGRIPIIIVPNRPDFELVLQALTRRNEPLPIAASVGAMMVAGYNNWDRIHRYKADWRKRNPDGDWGTTFKLLISQRHLYQDRFILLSSGPYSDVDSQAMGFTDEDWLEKSVTIRLEHECVHYFTRRVFGVMKNSLHDELMADYLGMVSACGTFHADWFLRFLGLVDFPRLIDGGRLQTYRGSPPLSDGAFEVLKHLVRSVAQHLAAANRRHPLPDDVAGRARVLCGLCSLTVEAMAGEQGIELLTKALDPAQSPPRP